MVADVRRSLEEGYKDKCSIFEYEEVSKGSFTEMKAVLKHDDVPCRLSYKRIPITANKKNAGYITLSVKIFLAPEIHIKPGSKIIVNHMGIKEEYASSSARALYDTHQEIELELYSKNA